MCHLSWTPFPLPLTHLSCLELPHCCGLVGVDSSQRQVAIKIFDKNRFKEPHALAQVEKEINAVRLTNHYNIVKYVEVLETGNRVFLVMENVSNGELYDYIQSNSHWSEFIPIRVITVINVISMSLIFDVIMIIISNWLISSKSNWSNSFQVIELDFDCLSIWLK